MPVARKKWRCADLSDSCFPMAGDRICAHAIPPPREGPACNGAASSTLPGVRLQFPDDKCSYTQAVLAAGIVMKYELVIDADVTGVHPTPADAGRCGMPDAASGLIVGFKLEGQGQQFCRCDVGPCPGGTFTTTARKGTYAGGIAWDGRNWGGPSDTNNPKGPPFPPGTYTLTVSAGGTREVAGGAPQSFAVSAARFITVE